MAADTMFGAGKYAPEIREEVESLSCEAGTTSRHLFPATVPSVTALERKDPCPYCTPRCPHCGRPYESEAARLWDYGRYGYPYGGPHWQYFPQYAFSGSANGVPFGPGPGTGGSPHGC